MAQAKVIELSTRSRVSEVSPKLSSLTMTVADALEMIAELQECNKGAVHDVLAKYGITFETRLRGQYDAHDDKIVEIVSKYELGLHSKGIKYLLDQVEGLEVLKDTQFNARLQSLRKDNRIAYNEAMGTYGATGSKKK